ncbi:MAG: hypothetical protein V3S45_01375, partial [Kiloniellales bacterium]
LTDAAREWLAKEGYEPAFGARPLARVIQERVKKSLAEELLFGKLTKGGVVRVDVEDRVPVFTYEAAETGSKGRGKGGSKGRPKGGSKGGKGGPGGGKPSKDRAELVE